MARVARLGERVESGVLAPCSSDKGCICNEWTYKRLLFTFALTLVRGTSPCCLEIQVSSAGSLPTHWLWTDLRVLTNCLAPLSVPVLIELLLLISSWLLQL